jgi:hypothetical protein
MKTKHIILFVIAALVTSNIARLIFEHVFPSSASVEDVAAKLNSKDPAKVVQGFQRLAGQRDPSAISRALQLLESPDESIWLNAALYLGACNRKEAVPYLIKALRHTSSRSDETTASRLKAITGQDFGADYGTWHKWWTVQPGHRPNFNWASNLGFSPRIKGSSRNP